MKQAVQQIVKQAAQTIKDESVEFVKTAQRQINPQEPGIPQEQTPEPGFQETQKRITDLKAQDLARTNQGMAQVRESLGSAGSSSASIPEAQAPKKPQTAPAIANPFEPGLQKLTQQVEEARKKAEAEKSASLQEQAEKAEKAKGLGLPPLVEPGSRQKMHGMPFTRAVKPLQGTGELKPSAGQQ